jgi:3-phenylpropionate/trans-cinnamate dioxygenase alpha subunit
MTYYLDGWLDRSPGGIEVVGLVKWVINGNWKIAAEQFAGDGYHAQVTHLSSPRHGAQFAKIDWRKGLQYGSRLGHGQGFSGPDLFREFIQSSGTEEDKPFNAFGVDRISEYNASHSAEWQARVGEGRPLGGHFTVFPNFSGLGGAANIRVWQPKGPNTFEIWSWTVVDADAPGDVKQAQTTGSVRTEGAAGMVEIDDGENWNLIGDLLTQGPKARSLSWNYQMGLGHEREDDPDYPGTIGHHAWGELPQRAFYRRYLEFLTSHEWPRIANDDTGQPLEGRTQR